jgi:tRNA 2-thiouridine synthesizing protein A
MLNEPIQPDAILDCIGLYCPQPIIRTAAQVKKMRPGEILEVQATDPVFQIDLRAWCLSHHHEFLGIRKEKAIFVGYVRLREDRVDKTRDG